MVDYAKIAAVHGDRHRLRKYGVPEETIGFIEHITLQDFQRWRAAESERVSYRNRIARRNRFNKLPKLQRQALQSIL